MQCVVRPVFRASVIVIVLFNVAALTARAVAERWLTDRGWALPAAKELSYLVVPILLAILMCPYLQRCKDSLLRLFRPRDLSLRLVLTSMLAGLFMRVTYWALIAAFVSFDVIGSGDRDATVGPIIHVVWPPLPGLLLGFAIMSVLVPVTEEIVNRGFILHSLMRRGPAVAVIVSAAIFAAMHDPQSYLLSFLAGLLLGVQMLEYRTLWGPVITHATFNTAMLVDQKCLYAVWNPVHPDAALVVVGAVSASIALFSAIACLLLVGERAVGAPRALRPAQGASAEAVDGVFSSRLVAEAPWYIGTEASKSKVRSQPVQSRARSQRRRPRRY
jgi:membrane protease YdiL (CAAX protease family)